MGLQTSRQTNKNCWALLSSALAPNQLTVHNILTEIELIFIGCFLLLCKRRNECCSLERIALKLSFYDCLSYGDIAIHCGIAFPVLPIKQLTYFYFTVCCDFQKGIETYRFDLCNQSIVIPSLPNERQWMGLWLWATLNFWMFPLLYARQRKVESGNATKYEHAKVPTNFVQYFFKWQDIVTVLRYSLVSVYLLFGPVFLKSTFINYPQTWSIISPRG